MRVDNLYLSEITFAIGEFSLKRKARDRKRANTEKT